MTTLPDATLHQDFNWPEMLVIDIVGEQYICLLEPSVIEHITWLHALFLRHIFYNDIHRATPVRNLLVAECKRHGVTTKDIAAVDRCTFWEIAALVQRKLRPSARTSEPIAISLHAAVCRLGTIGVAD